MRNNLGQWEDGISGNPKGRPPIQKVITDAIREELSTEYTGGLNDLEMNFTHRKYGTKLQEIVKRLVDEAIRGNINATKLIWVYIEGMPQRQEDQMETEGSQTIQINTNSEQQSTEKSTPEQPKQEVQGASV